MVSRSGGASGCGLMPLVSLCRVAGAGFFMTRRLLYGGAPKSLRDHGSGCRCGTGSTPGRGAAQTKFGQTAQIAAIVSADRDTPETHLTLACSPSTPDRPPSTNPPRKWGRRYVRGRWAQRFLTGASRTSDRIRAMPWPSAGIGSTTLLAAKVQVKHQGHPRRMRRVRQLAGQLESPGPVRASTSRTGP